MSTGMPFTQDHRLLELLLLVTLVVACVSSAAWLVAKRFRRNAPLRHLVLLSGLVCCLASPVLAGGCIAAGLTFVAIPLLPEPPAEIASANEPPETASPAGCTPSPAAALPATTDTVPANAGSVTSGGAIAMMACCPDTTPLAATTSAEPGPTASTLPAKSLPTAVVPASPFRTAAFGMMIASVAVTWLLLLRLAGHGWQTVRLRRSARPLRSQRHLALLRDVAAGLGMRTTPQLLVSDRAIVPLAIGFGRPAVLLPERLLAAVTDDEMRDVLLHEAAHLQRGDLRIVLLQELAGALYWPILPLRALNRELQRSREELCDNVVLADRDALDYGQTLLHVAELLTGARRTVGAVGMIGGRGELERRVAGLIDPRRSTRTTVSRTTALAVMFLFLCGAAIASTTRFTAADDRDNDSEQATVEPTENAAGPRDEPATGPKPADPPRKSPTDTATAESLINSLSQNTKWERGVRNDPWFTGVGDLAQTGSWKKRLPLAEAQAEAITLLDALVWFTLDRSDLTESGVSGIRFTQGKEARDRHQARRLAVLNHAEAMVRFGLLTPAQAEFVTARSLAREQGRLYQLEHDGVVRELLGLSDQQQQQFGEAHLGEARLPADAAVKAILTPAQQEIWSQLIAEKALPAGPPDVRPVSEEEASRIGLDEIFRKVTVNEKELRLSEDQQRALAILKDLTRRGLIWIDRRSESESPARLAKSRRRLLRHAGQFLLHGILTEEQAQIVL